MGAVGQKFLIIYGRIGENQLYKQEFKTFLGLVALE